MGPGKTSLVLGDCSLLGALAGDARGHHAVDPFADRGLLLGGAENGVGHAACDGEDHGGLAHVGDGGLAHLGMSAIGEIPVDRADQQLPRGAAGRVGADLGKIQAAAGDKLAADAGEGLVALVVAGVPVVAVMGALSIEGRGNGGGSARRWDWASWSRSWA